MAAQLVREWVGIQEFPAATQEKLVELLAKLSDQNVNTLTVLVMGKGGVGKSSTVNSIIGERVVTVSAFQSETPRPVLVSRSRGDFTLNIIDTPGLVEGGYVNDRVLDNIKLFLGSCLMTKTIDVLLYVDRLDAYRVDNLDKQIVKAISERFGKEIWHKAVVVLTHAQLSPPDALSYEEFLARRSESLMKCVRQGARLSKKDVQDVLSGDKATVHKVAQAGITATSPTSFGQISMVDDLLTAGPEPDSEIVGRAQGTIGLADLHDTAIQMGLNIVFTHGKYKGSTVTVLGRNPIFEKDRELPIVGGTGIFRLARGVAVSNTHSFDVETNYGVLEYTLYITHYC